MNGRQVARAGRRWVLSGLLRALARPHRLTGERTLVVAPHPDDETFGCGAMIAQRRAQGRQVHVLVLTNGEASLRQFPEVTPTTVAAARRQSAEQAVVMLELGAGDLTWLGWPDGGLPGPAAPSFAAARERLAALISEWAPDGLYLPHPLDAWPDHRAATALALAALAQQPAVAGCRVYGYLIWLWHGLPFRAFAQLLRTRPERQEAGAWQGQKEAAMAQYLAAHPPGMDVPWCGQLPAGLVAHLRRTPEYFFPLAPPPGPVGVTERERPGGQA